MATIASGTVAGVERPLQGGRASSQCLHAPIAPHIAMRPLHLHVSARSALAAVLASVWCSAFAAAQSSRPARPGSERADACTARQAFIPLPDTAVTASPTRGMRTKVVILGSGDPMPDPDRQGPAVAIVVDTSVYLVDAGVGVVRRAAEAASEHGIPALSPRRLGRVFITHLHSDHTLGLPDLMFTPWVMGRCASLRAWGPAGLQAMGNRLLDAWAEDIVMRQAWDRAGDTLGYRLVATELPPGASDSVVYDDGLVTVTAFAVQHGDWNDETLGNRAFGYRFDTPDLSVVVSGDTRPDTAAFTKFCNGCDILLHEVYSVRNRALTTDSLRRAYDRDFHTPSVALATEVAPAARPGLLVLYHATRYPGVTDDELLREVTRLYHGPGRRVCLGHDLDVFSLGAASPCAPPRSPGRRRR